MLFELILKQIIDCRDYFHITLRTRYNEEIARHDVPNLMLILFGLYHMSLIIFIAMMQYKSRIPVPPYLKNNLIVAILGGAIILSPLYFLNNLIMNKLNNTPIVENMSSQKQRTIGFKVFVMYASGVALPLLIGWSMQRFVPFLRGFNK